MSAWAAVGLGESEDRGQGKFKGQQGAGRKREVASVARGMCETSCRGPWCTVYGSVETHSVSVKSQSEETITANIA